MFFLLFAAASALPETRTGVCRSGFCELAPSEMRCKQVYVDRPLLCEVPDDPGLVIRDAREVCDGDECVVHFDVPYVFFSTYVCAGECPRSPAICTKTDGYLDCLTMAQRYGKEVKARIEGAPYAYVLYLDDAGDDACDPATDRACRALNLAQSSSKFTAFFTMLGLVMLGAFACGLDNYSKRLHALEERTSLKESLL